MNTGWRPILDSPSLPPSKKRLTKRPEIIRWKTGFRTRVYGDFLSIHDKGVYLLREGRRLNFFPQRQLRGRICPGLFLFGSIIYCIRYIEYAKVENGRASPVLSESAKSYFRKDAVQK